MQTVEVKIIEGCKAREVNTKTNPKMGVRHYNYESMLRTFEIIHIKGLRPKLGSSNGLQIGSIHKAQVIEGNKVIII